MKILVCSAWSEENKYLDIQFLKSQSIDINILNIGVGYLEAAINLTEFLTKSFNTKDPKYDLIIFLGTAGIYADPQNTETQLKIGDLAYVSSSSVSLPLEDMDLGFLSENNSMRDVLIPLRNDKHINSINDSSLIPEGITLKLAHCISNNEISKKAEFVNTVIQKRQKQFDNNSYTKPSNLLISSTPTYNIIENMELYGFAKVCKKFNLPWMSLLSISNFCHTGAHKEWKNNHANVSQKNCEALQHLLMKLV